ncbi:MKRN2 opposite strand protein-like [Ptychodera flava]|uniref:MKRN2 opposite strand protein-like n=1 Tax=Ptychodera flava TaxID=63121 RepID=UPI00396A00C6
MSSLRERGILCFNHCSPVNVLCFEIPDDCPVCGVSLDSSPCLSPPFRIPSPFANAKAIPYSVVIKPTVGTFLQDFKGNSNLHVGITNSKGAVYNYDEGGLHKDKDKYSWQQSISIPLLDKYDDELMELWDECLESYSSSELWTPARYDETTHNCYDLAIGFLNSISYGEFKGRSEAQLSRKSFCTEYIIPHTKKAARYIELYRKIESLKFVKKEESYC